TYTQGRLYVLQAPPGDLLQVHRILELEDTDDKEEEAILVTNSILLYKVDMAAKDLVLINDLHDQVLFLGCNQSQYRSADEFPQLKPNCVYFTDDEAYVWKYKNYCRDIGVINLENNKREEILPQLWCSWPNPIWVTPNLARMNWGCTNR
uniref:KIB1-4 beta-propeller domain-containing protein n=2 Tax=Aegilops tauschii subsp. strangulata TaxID=200361 RepID=A0A453CH48_AEGTS